MRRFFKHGLSLILVPVVRWYLRKERRHTYRGVGVTVFSGVFHPGLFSSTHFLIDYLAEHNLIRSSLIELGCGTALISICAFRQGATVTASDLSKRAIANATHNAKNNNATMRIVESDLFDQLGKERFDWIVVNPPYYSRVVTSEADLAWHCGENLQYFEKFFGSLAGHLHEGSQVIMILTKEGCDVSGIVKIAERNNFTLHLIKERNALLDGKDYLFSVRPAQTANRP